MMCVLSFHWVIAAKSMCFPSVRSFLGHVVHATPTIPARSSGQVTAVSGRALNHGTTEAWRLHVSTLH